FRDIPHSLFDSVPDIEKLHVEEDVLAGVAQFLRQPQSTSEKQLEANLVEVNRVTQLGDDCCRLVIGRHIECDYQDARGLLLGIVAIRHGTQVTLSPILTCSGADRRRLTWRSFAHKCAPGGSLPMQNPGSPRELADHALEQLLLGLVLQMTLLVEGLRSMRHGDLLRQHQRLQSDRQDLPQSKQPPRPAEPAW